MKQHEQISLFTNNQRQLFNIINIIKNIYPIHWKSLEIYKLSCITL